MKVTLLIPTLNEIDGLKVIMPRIKREWVDQILIVDGGSTDGTFEYAKDSGYDVIKQNAKGMRHAYIESLEYAIGDVIATFSPDGNSIPELIPALIEKMKEGYDMVIVSRYIKGAKSYDDDIITAFGNWMFTNLINLIYRSKYTDAMVMFRAYKADLPGLLDLDKDSSFTKEEKFFRTNVSYEPLMSIRAAKRKLKCADIPGDEPQRIGGERKLQIVKWGFAHLFEVIREVFVWM